MEREVIVVGHSILPKGTATRERHETLSIVALVDRSTHEVLRASATFTTPVNREWVEGHLVGRNLVHEPEVFVEIVERSYWGPAQRAIVQCYRDLLRRYHEQGAVAGEGGQPRADGEEGPAS